MKSVKTIRECSRIRHSLSNIRSNSIICMDIDDSSRYPYFMSSMKLWDREDESYKIGFKHIYHRRFNTLKYKCVTDKIINSIKRNKIGNFFNI